MSIIIKTEYEKWLVNLTLKYKESQIKAAVKVNSEMLKYYWNLGYGIVCLNAENKWGGKFYKNLSADLKKRIPNAHCFSEINLKYMKCFYDTYSIQYPLTLPQEDSELAQQITKDPKSIVM